jgi:hypothetical protein
MGGKRTYRGRLGKDRSARQSRHSIASGNTALAIPINLFSCPPRHARHPHAFGDPLALREIHGIVLSA